MTYSVDRASRQKFLLIANLMHFFMYLSIHFISLHVSSIKCSSSGNRIVLTHHLVWLVCVSDCLVWRSYWQTKQSHRLIIPDDVLIQFDLLMMSTVMLETCREMKWIDKYMKKCIILAINTFTAIVDLSRFNNSHLKSPASTLVDLTFQSRALRSFSLNQLGNLSL